MARNLRFSKTVQERSGWGINFNWFFPRSTRLGTRAKLLHVGQRMASPGGIVTAQIFSPSVIYRKVRWIFQAGHYAASPLSCSRHWPGVQHLPGRCLHSPLVTPPYVHWNHHVSCGYESNAGTPACPKPIIYNLWCTHRGHDVQQCLGLSDELRPWRFSS